MTADELRRAIAWLEARVRIAGTGDPPPIVWDPPTAEEMAAAGFDPAESRRLLSQPWWPEVAEDIVETPELAGAGTPPETVLRWARDVIGEAIRKRFPLEPP